MKPARPKSRRKILGLAVGEKSILVAEVASAPPAFPVLTPGADTVDRASSAATSPRAPHGASASPGAFEATQLAEFVFPEGLTLQQGEELGQALAQFLKDHGFTARHAVVGIPAKWVVVKPKQVPPAPAAVIAESLRLQAEGDFSQSDLVFDYAGQTSLEETRQVLLMATPRRYIDQVLAVAKAARLDATAVTPSAASLGWATCRSSRDAMVLSLGAAGAEFTAQCGTSPCVLRHLGPVPQTGPGPMFLSELRRTASLVPAPPPFAKAANGRPVGGASSKTQGAGSEGSAGNAPTRELVVWNGFSLDVAARQTVGDSLGMPVRAGDLAALGVSTTGSGPANPGHYAPAVALALSGLAGASDADEAPPVDFLHSRLTPPKARAVDRRIVWGVAVALLLLIVCGVALHQQHQAAWDLSQQQAKLKAQEAGAKLAKGEVAKIEYARNWQGGTPRFLPSLRDLTVAMPEDGQTFLTNFDLKDNMKGTLQGKSTKDSNVLALRDRLSASGQFKDVTYSLVARDTARNGREVQFTINFTYVGHD